MSDKHVLFSDDFSCYPVGPVPNSYSPWGEYHCRTDQGRLGPWREATTHYSWRDSQGCWRVIEVEGRRVLEQQYWTERSYPLLVTGDDSWGCYSARVDLRLLSFAGPTGLVVGYRHSRDFLALLAAEGQLSLVRRRHGRDEVLGVVGVDIGTRAYRRLTLDCEPDRVRAVFDGRTVLDVAFTFPGGRIGLIANAPARFADVEVTTREPGAAVGRRKAASVSLSSRREAYPQPKLWRRIETRGFGTDRNLRIGDLNGDGRNEIVLAQPRCYLGSGDFCNIAALTALDLDGNVLWRLGTPTATCSETTADLCFQVHDIDGDGRAEVLYASDLDLRIADGATGETIRSTPTPESLPPKRTAGAYPLARILGDCLHFADMQGTGRKDTILLKDRYTRAWAYDAELNRLWDHRCTTGHYPASADIDGDGRDELMLGYTLLSGDGQVRWELDALDHADGIVMGQIGPEGTPPRIALTGSDAGFFLLDAAGGILCHREIGHAQTVAALKLRCDVPGLQLVVNTYWGEPGITLIMDWNGNVLREFEPMHYASLLHPVNWPHDGTELVLLSTHPGEGGMIDGNGQRVVMFPDDGHPFLCCDSKDVDGDGVDEVLTWDHDSIWIYKAESLPGGSRDAYPVRNAFFNESNYSGQFSFPRDR